MCGPTLNSLPPELVHHIFSFACTDGGTTSHSLCLVSKYISGIAAPFVWRSISISGHLCLHDFASRLEENPHHAQLVEDLFLCDLHPEDTRVKQFESGTSLYEVVSAMEDEEENQNEIDTLIETFSRVLSAVAPSLRSLCFFCFVGMRETDVIGLIFSTPLVKLTELTISSTFSIHDVIHPLPRLERLFFANGGADILLDFLGSLFPTLTHLRIWNGQLYHSALLQLLYGVELSKLAARTLEYHTVPDAMSLPPYLQSVVVEMPPKPEGPQGCSRPYSHWLDVIHDFEYLQGAVPSVIQLGGKHRSYRYTEARSDWDNTRCGRGGFWPFTKVEEMPRRL